MNNILSMLASAAPQAQGHASAEMERRARANGFRSAEEMLAWARQRNQQTGGTIPQGSRPGEPSMQAALAWHPANILNFILGKWKGAMDGN